MGVSLNLLCCSRRTCTPTCRRLNDWHDKCLQKQKIFLNYKTPVARTTLFGTSSICDFHLGRS